MTLFLSPVNDLKLTMGKMTRRKSYSVPHPRGSAKGATILTCEGVSSEEGGRTVPL